MGVGAAIGGAIAVGGAVAGNVQSNKANNALDDSRNQIMQGYEDAFGAYDDALGTYKTGMDATNANWQQSHDAMQGTMDSFMDMSGAAVGQANANYANAQSMAGQMMAVGNQARADAQGVMDDWENTFGGIQDNLSEYYSNLDPVKFATQNKVSLQSAMDKQMQQMNDTMAAAGVQTAGMKQQAQKESAFELAKGNAAIDMAAPEQVAQMQQGFVNSGDNQYNAGVSMMNSANNLTGQMASAGANLVNSAGQGVTAAMNAQAQGAAQLGQAQSNLYGQQANSTANMYGNLANLEAGKSDLYAGQANALAGLSQQEAANYQNSANGWMSLGGSALGAGLGYDNLMGKPSGGYTSDMLGPVRQDGRL